MNQLEVLIMGQAYLLTCPPESQALLENAAARVDRVMCRIRDTGKGRVRDRIAVLAALNLAFELAQQASPHGPRLALDTSYPIEADETDKAVRAVLTTLLQRLDEILLSTSPPLPPPLSASPTERA